jgi:hypothetical protein
LIPDSNLGFQDKARLEDVGGGGERKILLRSFLLSVRSNKKKSGEFKHKKTDSP